MRRVTRGAAVAGAVLFVVAVVVHPRRDGVHIAEAGQWYGFTHGVEAVGLILQVVAVCGMLAGERLRRGLGAAYLALLGAIWYFGLIVVDGTRNPVTARYAPHLVHTPADLDTGTAIIVLPALVFFPLGYAFLGRLIARHGSRLTGWALGIGAVLYATGGYAIFGLGPSSPAIEVLEIVGVLPFAAGFVRAAWILTAPAITADEHADAPPFVATPDVRPRWSRT